jgi:hypothetical protein
VVLINVLRGDSRFISTASCQSMACEKDRHLCRKEGQLLLNVKERLSNFFH